MDIVWAALLGVVQGFTEFLPISSSGHLVIIQSIIPGFTQPGVLFDVVLHLGTLLSVLIFYRKKLIKMDPGYIILLLLGTIPVAIVGYLFQDYIEVLFSSIKLVGVALIITGVLNWLTDLAVSKNHTIGKKDSVLIGLAQAFAIIPGISRSGSTIFVGSKLGVKKGKAAEFSFLLSIPAILGASFLQIIKHSGGETNNIALYLIGFVAAFMSGYLAINLVIKTLKKRNFRVFAVYCIALGGLVLIVF